MFRANINNRAFEWMGERFAPIIDYHHFMGKSAFDVARRAGRDYPLANLKQQDELYILELVVPGFRKEDISIMLDDGILTIRGEKSKSDQAAPGAELILEEFSLETFERKFRLAPAIAHERITAGYDNGILRLTFIDVPKEQEKTIQTIKVE